MEPKEEDARFTIRIAVQNEDSYQIDWDAPTPAPLLCEGYKHLGRKAARLYSAMLQAHHRGQTFPAPQRLRERSPGLRRHFDKLRRTGLMRTIRGMGNRTLAIELAEPEGLPVHDPHEHAREPEASQKKDVEGERSHIGRRACTGRAIPRARRRAAAREREGRALLVELAKRLRESRG